MTASGLKVSVVVPTFWRPDQIARCLTALQRQDLPPDEFEIIVADDAASRECERLVTAFASQSRPGPTIRYVPVHDAHGPAAARNLGWRAAGAEIVAFTDDDCVPSPSWLRHGLQAMKDGADGVWGAVRVPIPPNPTDYEREVSRLEDAEFATANCFFRRSAIAEIGGFDERYTAAWREDSDLWFSLLEHGKRLVHAPDALVVHPVRPAPWGISLRLQRLSQFNALLYKKHPVLYRARVQSAPPIRYYSILASALGFVGGLLTRRHPVAAAAAALWILLTGQFCAERLRATSRHPSHVAEILVTSSLIPLVSIFWRVRGAFRFRVVFL
ncbi:MAG TPA: glycosyltransferase [Chloroflexota bacterium]|nr:glycosyltransferase [Chloroflexota bacterium]